MAGIEDGGAANSADGDAVVKVTQFTHEGTLPVHGRTANPMGAVGVDLLDR